MDVSFIAQVSKERHPGVYKKCKGIVGAIRKTGLHVSELLVEDVGIRGALKFCRSILRARSPRIYIRCTEVWIMIPAGVFAYLARIRGSRVILEIPTPLRSALVETTVSAGMNPVKGLVKRFLIRVAGPLIVLPYDAILQYSEPDVYFDCLIKKRVRLVSNCIDTSVSACRSFGPDWPSQRFVFLGVGNLAAWHGYDRVLRGIAAFNATACSTKAYFIVVGVGNDTLNLKRLAIELGILNYVCFAGLQSGGDLDESFESAHVGVSTIAPHRWGLTVASPLKSREYSSRGLPFIYACDDQHYDQSEGGEALKITAADEGIDVESIIDWFETCAANSGDIRRFAQRYLTYDAHVSDFL